MFKLYNWKKEIYSGDLINVIVNGLIAAILGGILSGALDYLFTYLGISISFGLVILVYLIGLRMKKGYYEFHILYPVLTIPFLILGLFFSHFAYYALCKVFLLNNYQIFSIFIEPSFYKSFILSPVSELIRGIQGKNALYIVFGTINIIFHIWAFVFCYRVVKGRN